MAILVISLYFIAVTEASFALKDGSRCDCCAKHGIDIVCAPDERKTRVTQVTFNNTCELKERELSFYPGNMKSRS